MKNLETLDTMGHHCAAASIMTKRNLKVDLDKCVQMYRAPFLYLPGAPNSLNPPLILVVCLGVVIMLENCRSAQFLKGGHHVLVQNVTVHVGIHVSINEPQLPSTSSTHVAPDHDATTTMVDCRQHTQFSWYSSAGRRHTCWTPSEPNKFILVSSDHRTWFQ